MSTNYYVKTHLVQGMHIGLSTAGSFIFRHYPGKAESTEQWMSLLEGHAVVDEYGRVSSSEEFREFILGMKAEATKSLARKTEEYGAGDVYTDPWGFVFCKVEFS